jgi:hypothetical protein
MHPRRLARPVATLCALSLIGSGLIAGSALTAHAASTGSPGDPTISANNLRDGWDNSEPALLPDDVTKPDFGPLFATDVQGQVYAQPLIAKESSASDGTLIVATEQDSVDGMNPATGAISWTDQLGTPWSSSVLSCGDLTPDIGVTSTPVYDPATNTVYVMAKEAPSDQPATTSPQWFLHALDASSGAERAGWPVQIGGHPDNDPTETFNSETAGQRPGLLLMGGVVYAGFASHCDHQPYDGYVVGVNTSTAKQTAMFSTEVGEANGEGGIWQSGGGLVSDGPGQIIVTTGNGDTSPVADRASPPSSLSEAVVRLAVQSDGTLKATDWFSPISRDTLDEYDTDLGAGGPIAIPNGYGTAAYPHLLVQDGKDGHVYLLNRDSLGGLGQAPRGGDEVLGVTGPYNGQWDHPAFWAGTGGAYVYIVENAGYLRALQLTANVEGKPVLTSAATSAATFGYTSGSPIVTSDSSGDPNAGVVWVVSVDGVTGTTPVLNAYDALPGSNGVLTRLNGWPLDPPDVTDPTQAHGAKFATVATDDGRVFVGTRDGYVFGFGAPSTAALDSSPTDFGNVPVGGSATLPVTLTATTQTTVTAATAQPPYSVDDSSLPVTLQSGQSVTLNVRFSPTEPADQSRALMVTTDQGLVTFDLDGYGIRPGLLANPSSVSFGKVAVGSVNTAGINLVNVSGESETFDVDHSSLKPPFTSADLPPSGSTIQAGASLAIPLTYAPRKASSTDTGSLRFTVTGTPTVTVSVHGRAAKGAPIMTLAPVTLNFGLVPRGHSVTKSFRIRNTGNFTLTLEKAAPPSGVFTTSNPVSEGSKVLPGAAILQTVTFTPTKHGRATASYLITGDDSQGHQAEKLVGWDDVIADWYRRHGGAASFLGKPLHAEGPVANGFKRDYRHGRLYWSAKTSVHELHGHILHRYLALHGASGEVGFPATNVQTLGNGKRSQFASGWSIYWSRATGAWAVYGKVARRWRALGAQAGRLGYPVGNVHDIPGGQRGLFRHGDITWTRKAGFVVRYRPHGPA